LSLEEQQLDLQLMLKSQIISQLIFHDCWIKFLFIFLYKMG
jgi:hypothetical protein